MRVDFNENYFENIDTEDKAYWLGFLYADGYVRIGKRNSCQLKLKLSQKDKDHILKFKNCIESKKDIKDSKDVFFSNGKEYISLSSTFNVYSFKIVNDLISHGCVNNKTQKIRFPNLNNNLIYHFIRGYFDGDGCIFKNKNRPNSFTISICSNKIFVEELSSFLEIGKIINYKNYSLLTFNKIDDIKNFRDLIYKNCNICLERKKIIFDKIKNVYNKDYSYTKTFRKNYSIIDPNGNEHFVNHLKEFCLNNSLIYSTMSNLSRGIGKSNKGWTCKKIIN